MPISREAESGSNPYVSPAEVGRYCPPEPVAISGMRIGLPSAPAVWVRAHDDRLSPWAFGALDQVPVDGGDVGERFGPRPIVHFPDQEAEAPCVGCRMAGCFLRRGRNVPWMIGLVGYACRCRAPRVTVDERIAMAFQSAVACPTPNNPDVA